MLLWPSYDEFVEQYTPGRKARLEQRKDVHFPFYPHGDVEGSPSRELREALFRASQVAGGRVVGLVPRQATHLPSSSFVGEGYSSDSSVFAEWSPGFRALRENTARQAYRVHDNPRYTKEFFSPTFVLRV
jgi:hypothetical protein